MHVIKLYMLKLPKGYDVVPKIDLYPENDNSGSHAVKIPSSAQVQYFNHLERVVQHRPMIRED